MREHKLYLKLRNGAETLLLVPFESVVHLVKQGVKIIRETRRLQRGQKEDRLHIVENCPGHPQDPSNGQERGGGQAG